MPSADNEVCADVHFFLCSSDSKYTKPGEMCKV